jgi:hypothetical protein
MPSYNAACDAGFYDAETLAEMRYDIIVRLGYASQASNPPPGMAILVDSFLKRGQAFLYRRYKALHTARWFTWTMTEGERFYGLRDNTDACSKKLDPSKILEAWVEDLNGTWLPLERGINPGLFTGITQNGMPARYDIHQEIEVFPAPDEAYTLRVKGHFGLLSFTEDTDIATIDSELLFLWALANAKNHYGQPDAGDIAEQAKSMLRELVAASHGNKRYIPHAGVAAPMTKPSFPSMGEGDA